MKGRREEASRDRLERKLSVIEVRQNWASKGKNTLDKVFHRDNVLIKKRMSVVEGRCMFSDSSRDRIFYDYYFINYRVVRVSTVGLRKVRTYVRTVLRDDEGNVFSPKSKTSRVSTMSTPTPSPLQEIPFLKFMYLNFLSTFTYK